MMWCVGVRIIGNRDMSRLLHGTPRVVEGWSEGGGSSLGTEVKCPLFCPRLWSSLEGCPVQETANRGHEISGSGYPT